MMDIDDLDFFLLLGPGKGWGCAILWFVVILGVIGLIWLNADSCSTTCAPLEGRVVDHACYCVETNGQLRVVEVPG